MRLRPFHLIAALSLAMVFAACDNGGGGSGLDDGLPDDGQDTGEPNYCTEPEWTANAFEVDQVVANWEFNGYIDSDRDGVVEQDEVPFTMEDINCMGYNSLVLMIGSTS